MLYGIILTFVDLIVRQGFERGVLKKCHGGNKKYG